MASEEKVSESKAARVVYAEFDAWIQESGELFDTTHADLAKEKNIFNEKASYEPLPMLVGRGRLFPGLERSLEKAEVGKEYEVTLPPEDAAGPRDPKLVELFPIREFLRQEIVPEVGLQVTV
ncbi:MAG: FKBP-type peptidyl-prolyl cis-trans isomerase, partial [Thermoplasmata archaeon]